MTGQFAIKDAARCQHYASFMAGLSLAQANAIFWILFVTVLFLLYISSRQHHKSASLSGLEAGQKLSRHARSHRKGYIRTLRRQYLGIVTICLLLSVAFVILEVFAAFNIEYCDGEDLMMLYWGFWSVLQVGSIIAIFGVMLQMCIVLGDVETPSWAVALGTPVLVVAALVHVWDHSIRMLWRRNVIGEYDWGNSEADLERIGRSKSAAPTLASEGEYSNRQTRKPSRMNSRHPSTRRSQSAPACRSSSTTEVATSGATLFSNSTMEGNER